MAKDSDEKPMTIKDFQEVIIPAMEGVFATKSDLEEVKRDIFDFRHEVLLGQDKIMKDLDILMTEQKMGYYQKQKERSLWTIMIEAMKEHQILSAEQVQKIKELGVF